MNEQAIIAAIDAEIARLAQIRRILGTGSTSSLPILRRANRAAKPVAKKRTLSPEARKRIADAQKKRWAQMKALSTGSVARKKAAKKSAGNASAQRSSAKSAAKKTEAAAQANT